MQDCMTLPLQVPALLCLLLGDVCSCKPSFSIRLAESDVRAILGAGFGGNTQHTATRVRAYAYHKNERIITLFCLALCLAEKTKGPAIYS